MRWIHFFFFMVMLLGFVYGLLPNPEVKNIVSYILLVLSWILTDVKIFIFKDLWFESSVPSPTFYYIRREHFNLGVERSVRTVNKFSPWPICHLENSLTLWVAAQERSPLWSLYKLPQLSFNSIYICIEHLLYTRPFPRSLGHSVE